MSFVLAIQPADPHAIDLGSTKMTVLTQTHSRRRADEIQFSVVSVLTFPVFLLSALARRLLPGRGPVRSGLAGESLSIVQEAKASAQTCGSFSLMG